MPLTTKEFIMAETKICPNCSAKNPAANNFCEQCGSKLSGAPQAEKASKPAPVAKTKAVNVSSETPSSYASPTSSTSSNFQPFIRLDDDCLCCSFIDYGLYPL